MIKTTNWLGGLLLAVSFFTGCGSDNAYDGTTGLGGGGVTSSETIASLSSIQTNILQKNANDFQEALEDMKKTLASKDNNLTQNTVEELQNSFRDILHKWKAVDSTYIIGKYDELLTDVPRFIEFFIKASKRQDIAAEVQDALDSTLDIEIALFKNTSKSMQALEYLLHGRQADISTLVEELNKNNHRRIDALIVVLDNLITRASSIAGFYNSDTLFIADTTKALNSLSNQLVQSAFDLREKRIGEPAGFVGNNAGHTIPTNFAYYNSNNSFFEAKAILEAHRQIMGVQSFENLGSFAAANGATMIVGKIRERITEALSILEKLGPFNEVVTEAGIQDANLEKFYGVVRALESDYQQSLINSLDLTANIIDADGD